MFKSWLICCRKVSSQLEGQNPGLGPPLPPRGHHDSPFSSQIYFKLRRDLRLISSRQVFLRCGPQQAAAPPPVEGQLLPSTLALFGICPISGPLLQGVHAFHTCSVLQLCFNNSRLTAILGSDFFPSFPSPGPASHGAPPPTWLGPHPPAFGT